MAFGDVTVTLRPMKFAFLVNPLERKVLDRVIGTSLFQWGGLQNPIIPIYRRLPTYWTDHPLRRLPTSEICKGYLRTFDPDVVVVCGDVDKAVIPASIQHVVTLDEMAGDLSKEDAPTLGVGLFEILASVAVEEFKFARRDGMKILMPSFKGAGSTLFRSMFGEIPLEARRATYNTLLKSVEVDQPTVTLSNFLDVLPSPNWFLSSLCSHKLEFRRHRSDRSTAIFLMNHENTLDLIDFWNLRAMGWHVLPLPLQLSSVAKVQDYVGRFIEMHSPKNTELHAITGVAVLKSRSVAQTDFTAFINALPPTTTPSIIAQVWYPPMWDEFTRRGGRVTCATVQADQAQTQVSDENSRIRVKTVSPAFMDSNLGHGARYAERADLPWTLP